MSAPERPRAASNAVTPATDPGAPTGVSAVAGQGQASVSFTAPASNGGSAITGYTVTATDSTTPANGNETGTGTTSPISVTGLHNGDSYTFKVTATNAIGTGPASSASNAVTPRSHRAGSPDRGLGHAGQRLGQRQLHRAGLQRRVHHHRLHGDGDRQHDSRQRQRDGHRHDQPDHCLGSDQR